MRGYQAPRGGGSVGRQCLTVIRHGSGRPEADRGTGTVEPAAGPAERRRMASGQYSRRAWIAV